MRYRFENAGAMLYNRMKSLRKSLSKRGVTGLFVRTNDRSLDRGREVVAAGVPGSRRAPGTGGSSLMEAHAGSSEGHPATLVDMLRLRAKKTTRLLERA